MNEQQREYQKYRRRSTISSTKKPRWTDDEILQFLTLTDRSRDLDVAQSLNRSLSSIQAYRRKLNLLRKLKMTPSIELLKVSEKNLRKLLQEFLDPKP
jgi:DNA-binding NarL/FixJ family response regulator